MSLRGILLSILAGLPGGGLIIMSMFMFNAVLGPLVPSGQWTLLVILSFTSLVVGMLVRLVQPFHGLGTAIASGVIAALILLILRMSSTPGTGKSLVFGSVGVLVTIGFCLFGAWIIPHRRKRAGKRT